MLFCLLRPLIAAILIGLLIGSPPNGIAQPAPQAQNFEQPKASANEKAEHDQKSKTFEEMLAVILDKTWDDPVAFFTFVLAVFTGVLGISTIGLWIVTAKGIRNQARDTQILERAYLTVEPAGIWEHHDRGDRVVAKITIRNVGHLPARNVIWWSSGDFPRMGELDVSIEEPRGMGVVLAPGAATTRRAAIVFTMREGHAIVDNTLHVWGIVRYRDGFGRKQFIRFRHHYITKPMIGTPVFSMPGDVAEMDEEGNDAN